AAVPHQPGADHAVDRIDEEAHVALLTQYQVSTRGKRVHYDVAQHGPADQKWFEHRLAKRAAAAAVGSSDLAPRRHFRQISTTAVLRAHNGATGLRPKCGGEG